MVEQDTISVDATSLETIDIPVDIDPTEEREIGNYIEFYFWQICFVALNML